MRGLAATAMAAMVLPGTAFGTEVGDQLAQRLYDGTLAEISELATTRCDEYHADACFALGLFDLVTAVEGVSQALYRHGATRPGTPAAAMLFGLEPDGPAVPANPDPELLTYAQLRAILDQFVAGLDVAGGHFQMAETGTQFVIPIDPLKVRIDLDGNGTAEAGETLGALLASARQFADIPTPDAPPPGGKSKAKGIAGDTSIGFDNADAAWFAGYTQIAAAPVDLLLAHDFSGFFDAYLHRVFPQAGLPMQDFTKGGMLLMDAESDAAIADLVAAVHTINFPVIDAPRLSGVLDRLKAITAHSRRNWELILAETDDNRELVPSPSQTSIVLNMGVTQETVDAWMAALDTADLVLNGKLLVPHWRFKQGVDLKAYFETAKQTDLVMILTGLGALPFLKDGPIASAESFAEANKAFGAEWLNYAFWFN
jgi:hypothetical protein